MSNHLNTYVFRVGLKGRLEPNRHGILLPDEVMPILLRVLFMVPLKDSILNSLMQVIEKMCSYESTRVTILRMLMSLLFSIDNNGEAVFSDDGTADLLNLLPRTIIGADDESPISINSTTTEAPGANSLNKPGDLTFGSKSTTPPIVIIRVLALLGHISKQRPAMSTHFFFCGRSKPANLLVPPSLDAHERPSRYSLRTPAKVPSSRPLKRQKRNKSPSQSLTLPPQATQGPVALRKQFSYNPWLVHVFSLFSRPLFNSSREHSGVLIQFLSSLLAGASLLHQVGVYERARLEWGGNLFKFALLPRQDSRSRQQRFEQKESEQKQSEQKQSEQNQTKSKQDEANSKASGNKFSTCATIKIPPSIPIAYLRSFTGVLKDEQCSRETFDLAKKTIVLLAVNAVNRYEIIVAIDLMIVVQL